MDHTVTYRFGRADYIALLRAQRSLSVLNRFGRWGRYACFGLFFVVLINLSNISSWSFDPALDLITSAIAFALIVLVAPVGELIADRILSLLVFPRFSVANKDLTLTFADDGIRSQHGGMEGKIPWSAVKRILETKDHLFLSISRAENMVVPRRALPSPDAAVELAHYIRSEVDAAAGGSAESPSPGQ
jgi:YcxB-like protein